MSLPPAAPYNEMAVNNDDWSFAYGKGCAAAPTGTWSGTGVPAGYCAEVKIAGIASCFSYMDIVANYNYYGSNSSWIQPTDRGLQGQTVKPHINCYCKITYPFATSWRLAETYITENGCKEYCVSYCSAAFGVF